MTPDTNESPAVNPPRKKRRPCNRPRVCPAPWDRNRTRPEYVKASLSPDEYRTLRQAANVCGLTVAVFMRTAALLHAAPLLGVPIQPESPAI